MTRRNQPLFPIAAALTILLAMPLGLLAHGHGHVQGTVNDIDAAQIDVKTSDGKSRKVALTGKTKYLRGKAAAAIGDVKPGERVVVHLDEDGSALEVHLAPTGAAGSDHKH
ncbi:MAG TPA: hypothetical protein VE007_06020 [Thermoanaerobaculia bacterium]|nr:hypothetical protein [Thermoanaerobaculia bacterium]